MEKEKSKIALAAKVIGGSILLFVFVMNIMVFAKKDPVTGNLSLTSLEASAQGEGGIWPGANSTYMDLVWEPYPEPGQFVWVEVAYCVPSPSFCAL